MAGIPKTRTFFPSSFGLSALRVRSGRSGRATSSSPVGRERLDPGGLRQGLSNRPVLTVSDSWKTTYPGAVAGALVVRGVSNPTHHAGLDQRIATWDVELRTRFRGSDRTALRAHPILQAYAGVYRPFHKTYHVELQLESVLFKAKAMPRSPALVAAMVAAELKNGLLTAGHDLAAVEIPVTLGVAAGGDAIAS